MADLGPEQSEERDPRLPTIADLMGLQRGAAGNPLQPGRGAVAGAPAAMAAPQSQPEEMGTTGSTTSPTTTPAGSLDPSKIPSALSGIINAQPTPPTSGDEVQRQQNRQASNAALLQSQQANNALAATTAARGQLSPPVARDPNTGKVYHGETIDGKQMPNYRMGIGGRLANLGKGFLSGMEKHGLIGGIEGAADAAIDRENPDYYGKGALNARYGQDVAAEQVKAANLDDLISHQQKLAEAAQGMYGKVNSAEAADVRGQALTSRADTYKEMSDQRGEKIDPNTLAPDDPDKPEGSWHGQTISGETKSGLSAPPYAARIAAKGNELSAEGKTTAARGTIADQYGLKGKDRDMYILNGKVPEGMTPYQQQELKLRAREVAVQEGKAGQGKSIPKGTSDKIIADKNKAINVARENFKTHFDKDGNTYDFDDYMHDWQAAQDNFEQQIENNTGQKPEHIDIRSNVDKQGNAKPAAASTAGSSAPAEKTLKDGKGNTVHAIVKGGKWVNKATGAAL